MKQPWNRTTISRNAFFGLLLLFIAVATHGIFGDHGWLALRRQKREYESLQQQIQQLQRENQQLEQQIKALKSDPKAIERLAREQMRLARPGEIIFTLPSRNPKSGPVTPPPHQNQSK